MRVLTLRSSGSVRGQGPGPHPAARPLRNFLDEVRGAFGLDYVDFNGRRLDLDKTIVVV